MPAMASTIASNSPLVELLQARVDVAAQIDDFKVRPVVPQLRLTPQAAGADSRARRNPFKLRPWREIRQSRGSSRRVIAGKRQPVGNLGRNVLHAVDRQVHRIRQERVFQLLDENSLAAELRADLFVNLSHGRGLHAVARGADANDFGFDAVEFARAGRRCGSLARAPARCRGVPMRSRSLVAPCRPRDSSIDAEKMAQGFDRAQPAAHFARIAKRSAGSSSTRSINSSVMRREALAFLGRKILHFGKPFAQQTFRDACGTGRARSSTIEPASRAARQFSNFAMCSAMMASARGISASRARLFCSDDFAEVVDVVEVQIVETGRFRSRRCAARPSPPRTPAGRCEPPARAPAFLA